MGCLAASCVSWYQVLHFTQTGPDNFSFSTRLRWKSPPFSLDLPSSVGEGLGWSGWLSYLDQYHQLPIPSAGPATGCEEKISGDFALLVRSAVRYQASSHSWPHPNCSLERARYSAIRNRDLFIRYFKSGCLLLGLTFHYSTLGLLSELSKLSIHVETSKKFFKQGATHWGESVRCQM